ncbi:head closure Hc2 [Synechococcus phage S-SM2]|uniref:Neck protein n=1 Tax=Synechococcus phage S-SM2 TaxID=444860 RepID=E3SIZ8_9CAUD|nr:head closure Hc2 [Synechococcus phage S-SM2]ADO97446.1 neck protein [Synechococcus phage S-SM2]
MLNPYFQQGSRSEQNLVQDLINEQLRMYGVEIHYLPRKYLSENTIIREVIQSKFDDAYPIEAYVDNFDGYGDNTTILSKFGIQATNEITLIISKERFETYISPLIKNEQNIKLSTRPKEGDLIYFPLGDRLFEIKFVEHEKPFYQLQKNYVYELRCELFRLGDEVIDTGIDEIDDTLTGGESDGLTEDGISTLVGPSQTLTLVGTGVTATAVTGIITSGGLRLITVTNRGGGYTGVPRIGISSAPSGGVTGIASARMIGGIVVCNESANPKARSVQAVDIVNPGAGYTVAPGIRFIGGGGAGAAATTKIGDGIVGVVTLTDSGSGYTTSPTITFSNEVFLSGVTTVSAAATAVVGAGGTLTSIRLTNAGLGYSTAPTITISDPNMSSSGDFVFNEIVTGSVSGTTGRVKTWNSTTNALEVYNVNGSFSVGENIVGSTSGASHGLLTASEDPADDGFADNINIETEADSILDFSEQNPFGIP